MNMDVDRETRDVVEIKKGQYVEGKVATEN
jgi:hypothetical protein